MVTFGLVHGAVFGCFQDWLGPAFDEFMPCFGACFLMRRHTAEHRWIFLALFFSGAGALSEPSVISLDTHLSREAHFDFSQLWL